MTTKSLFDLLDDLSSPIERAQQAVREDSAEKLLAVLNPKDDDQKALIKEDTFVNPQAKENLLHFAVHQSAAICASLLCEKPYSWNVDRPNLIGRSPVHLAQLRGYAPVWYPLVTHSHQAPLTGSENDHLPPNVTLRTVTALLIQPQLFIRKPFEWDEVFPNEHMNSLGPALALCSSRDEYDEDLSSANLNFLFELVNATPAVWSSLIPEPDSHLYPRRILTSSDIEHSANCTDYPRCLLNLIRQPQETAKRLIFDLWAYHRLQVSPDRQMDNRLTATKQTYNSEHSEPSHAPFTLLEWCRMRIRQLATQKLVYSTSSIDSGTAPCLTYPQLIAQLPLPPSMRAYLAYREFWPAWKRHTLPARNLFRMFRTRTRPFEMRWFDVPDV